MPPAHAGSDNTLATSAHPAPGAILRSLPSSRRGVHCCARCRSCSDVDPNISTDVDFPTDLHLSAAPNVNRRRNDDFYGCSDSVRNIHFDLDTRCHVHCQSQRDVHGRTNEYSQRDRHRGDIADANRRHGHANVDGVVHGDKHRNGNTACNSFANARASDDNGTCPQRDVTRGGRAGAVEPDRRRMLPFRRVVRYEWLVHDHGPIRNLRPFRSTQQSTREHGRLDQHRYRERVVGHNIQRGCPRGKRGRG
jgi:hypothetical protein